MGRKRGEKGKEREEKENLEGNEMPLTLGVKGRTEQLISGEKKGREREGKVGKGEERREGLRKDHAGQLLLEPVLRRLGVAPKVSLWLSVAHR